MKRWFAAGLLFTLAPAWAGDEPDDGDLAALLEFIGTWELQGDEWLDPVDVDALMDMRAAVALEQETGNE